MGISGPFGQDVRCGVRSLLQARGFTVTAVLSLALGIAATTNLFSVIHFSAKKFDANKGAWIASRV
jgi:hypothetical protein